MEIWGSANYTIMVVIILVGIILIFIGGTLSIKHIVKKRRIKEKRENRKEKIEIRRQLRQLDDYYSDPEKVKELYNHEQYPPEFIKEIINHYNEIEDEDMRAIYYNFNKDILSKRE